MTHVDLTLMSWVAISGSVVGQICYPETTTNFFFERIRGGVNDGRDFQNFLEGCLLFRGHSLATQPVATIL